MDAFAFYFDEVDNGVLRFVSSIPTVFLQYRYFLSTRLVLIWHVPD